MITPAIMFHHFYDEKHHPRGQGAINQEQFYDFLKKNTQFKILSAEVWWEKYQKNNLLANETCITFDDNLKCQFDVALPVLETLNLKAFWFVYTSPLQGILEKLEVYRYFRTVYFESIDDFYEVFFSFFEKTFGQASYQNISFNDYLNEFTFYTYNDRKFRYIRDIILSPEEFYALMNLLLEQYHVKMDTWKDILWLSKNEISYLSHTGHFIGLHSHTHPTKIEAMTAKEQESEYLTNYQILKEITHNQIFSMSHPCNSYNEATLEVLKNLNIKIGFRSNNSKRHYLCHELPRIDHTYLIKS
ncbi:MAG: hypothetical protein OHK0057_14590 [Thermoflexibacter sp.]